MAALLEIGVADFAAVQFRRVKASKKLFGAGVFGIRKNVNGVLLWANNMILLS